MEPGMCTYTGVGTLEVMVPAVACIWGARGERGAKVNVAMKVSREGIRGLEAELPWKDWESGGAVLEKTRGRKDGGS